MNGEHVDIAVYVALQEEFKLILPIISATVEISEDEEISITYYRSALPSDVTNVKWNILMVPAGAMGQQRAAAVTAHINARFKPDNIVVIGIAGSLTSD